MRRQAAVSENLSGNKSTAGLGKEVTRPAFSRARDAPYMVSLIGHAAGGRVDAPNLRACPNVATEARGTEQRRVRGRGAALLLLLWGDDGVGKHKMSGCDR